MENLSASGNHREGTCGLTTTFAKSCNQKNRPSSYAANFFCEVIIMQKSIRNLARLLLLKRQNISNKIQGFR